MMWLVDAPATIIFLTVLYIMAQAGSLNAPLISYTCLYLRRTENSTCGGDARQSIIQCDKNKPHPAYITSCAGMGRVNI